MRKLLFYAITFSASFLVIELVMRGYFAINVGPSVLLYGTPLHHLQVESVASPEAAGTVQRDNWKSFKQRVPGEQLPERTVERHVNDLGGYSKYFPGQKRVDFDIETGESFPVTINNRGFRGRDFETAAQPGIVRVVTLGASSTFGYFDRDDETYPVYLESMLNALEPGRRRFEVINLGIPHLRAAAIRELFLAEAVQLRPDIVTFYEGNNDAATITAYFGPRTFAQRMQHAIDKAGRWFVAFGLLDSLVDTYARARYPLPAFNRHAASISAGFLESLDGILQVCREQGITLVVANQQKNSDTLPRPMLKGITYREEVDRVRHKLVEREEVDSQELRLLAHAVLMKDLEQWAARNDVAFVDVIASLDRDRDVLLSEVHLSPRGNRMVAAAFFDRIRALLGDDEREPQRGQPPLQGATDRAPPGCRARARGTACAGRG